MLTREDIWSVTRVQLALDLGYTPKLFESNGNQVVEWRDLPGRRKYCADRPFLEILIMDGKLIASANAVFLPWCRENLLPRQAEWLFLPNNHRRIENGLAPFGYEIGDARHFYLPTLPCIEPVLPCPVRWYEKAELAQFRAGGLWSEALAFNVYTPDMLAVAAVDETGVPVAMAGASRDGERFWQIGIRVLPDYQGRGLGSGLTALLKQELLRRDIVPFYSTAESHIFSQNVGLSAGFRPAFGYLYAQRRR